MENRTVNLIPFRHQLNTEIILNIIVFIPLGVYAGILFERWIFGKKLLFFFFISLIVEAIQFILAIGAFDITDVITNTLGGVIGFLLFKGVQKVFNSNIKAQKCINIIAAIGTVSMIVLLLLLKMNMLPVRYQ